MEKGELLTKWQECPFNWLINYKEHRDSTDWDKWKKGVSKLTRERIEKMPKEVKECINNTYKDA